MVDVISIDVYPLVGAGKGKIYEVDISTTIYNLIENIVRTHSSFMNSQTFNPNMIDWSNTRLIYNGKTLDPKKTLEDYSDFQYKSRGPYKMHLLVKGGIINLTPLPPPPILQTQTSSTKDSRSTSPLEIKGISGYPSPHSSASPFSGTSIMSAMSRSYPGASSCLQDVPQINPFQKGLMMSGRLESGSRISDTRSSVSETRDRISEARSSVSDSLSELSQHLKQESMYTSSEKMDLILNTLLSIDQKLAQLFNV